jgi:hypothetical protein
MFPKRRHVYGNARLLRMVSLGYVKSYIEKMRNGEKKALYRTIITALRQQLAS